MSEKRAAVIILAMVWLSGVPLAHADHGDCGVDPSGVCASAPMPDVGTPICVALALGMSPEEIAQKLHDGDPRWSEWQTGQTVRNQIESGCP